MKLTTDLFTWSKVIAVNIVIGSVVVSLANFIIQITAPGLYSNTQMLTLLDAGLLMIYISARDSIRVEMTNTERVLAEIDDKVPTNALDIARDSGIDRVDVQDCLDLLVSDGIIEKRFDGYVIKTKPPKAATKTETA